MTRYEITVGVDEEDLQEIIKALSKIDVRKITKTLTIAYQPPLAVSKLSENVENTSQQGKQRRN